VSGVSKDESRGFSTWLDRRCLTPDGELESIWPLQDDRPTIASSNVRRLGVANSATGGARKRVARPWLGHDRSSAANVREIEGKPTLGPSATNGRSWRHLRIPDSERGTEARPRRSHQRRGVLGSRSETA